jgi:predicted tellurium resistance membrane protein TerC
VFIGVKMCLVNVYKIPIEISLAFIVLTLSVAVLASMVIQAAQNSDKK